MCKTKVLVLGLGNFGHSWATEIVPACSESAELVGVVDQRKERWENISESVPKFTEICTALEETTPDLVINVTPPSAHAELTTMLLEKGFAVLCEKPIADSVKNAVKMGETQNNTNGFLMIGENYRYHRVFRVAKQIMQEKMLGNIHHIQCNFRHYHPDYSKYYHGTLAHPLIEDVTIHHLDLARYLSGKEPVRVWCKEYAAPYSWYGSRLASAKILTEMTDNVVFSYTGTLASPESSTDWNGHWEIECDNGVLQIKNGSVFALQNGGCTEYPVSEEVSDSRVTMLYEACRALKEHRNAETDFPDNMKTFLWMHCVIASAEKEVWVDIREGSATDVAEESC